VPPNSNHARRASHARTASLMVPGSTLSYNEPLVVETPLLQSTSLSISPKQSSSRSPSRAESSLGFVVPSPKSSLTIVPGSPDKSSSSVSPDTQTPLTLFPPTVPRTAPLRAALTARGHHRTSLADSRRVSFATHHHGQGHGHSDGSQSARSHARSASVLMPSNGSGHQSPTGTDTTSMNLLRGFYQREEARRRVLLERAKATRDIGTAGQDLILDGDVGLMGERWKSYHDEKEPLVQLSNPIILPVKQSPTPPIINQRSTPSPSPPSSNLSLSRAPGRHHRSVSTNFASIRARHPHMGPPPEPMLVPSLMHKNGSQTSRGHNKNDRRFRGSIGNGISMTRSRATSSSTSIASSAPSPPQGNEVNKEMDLKAKRRAKAAALEAMTPAEREIWQKQQRDRDLQERLESDTDDSDDGIVEDLSKETPQEKEARLKRDADKRLYAKLPPPL
jgi:hypothetical protein